MSLGKFLKLLRSPKYPEVLSLPSSRKAASVPYRERLLCIVCSCKKVPGHFSTGHLLSFKINLYFLNCSGDIQSLGMCLLNMTFKSNSWLIKSQFETDFMYPIIKRSGSYYTHENQHIAMDIIILTH